MPRPAHGVQAALSSLRRCGGLNHLELFPQRLLGVHRSWCCCIRSHSPGPSAGLPDCEYEDLTDGALARADLSDTNLRGADLANADLYRADLRDAILRAANLTYATLSIDERIRDCVDRQRRVRVAVGPNAARAGRARPGAPTRAAAAG